jgi:hypothetical protein
MPIAQLDAGFPLRQPDPRSGHVGFVVDNVALGHVFSKHFGFPFQFSFHQILHHHIIISIYHPGTG